LQRLATEQTIEQAVFTRQIRVDVPRTFAERGYEKFKVDLIPQGKNALYNVLIAYAQLDPDISYT
jgi:hypothetical protein